MIRTVRRGFRVGWAVAIGAFTLASGCASARQPFGDDPGDNWNQNQLRLRVTNRGHADVVVYLAGGSVPQRLGRVPATQRVDLVIRGQSAVGAPLRLVVRDVGSGVSFTPEAVWGRAGDTVELTVQPLLGTSELTVR